MRAEIFQKTHNEAGGAKKFHGHKQKKWKTLECPRRCRHCEVHFHEIEKVKMMADIVFIPIITPLTMLMLGERKKKKANKSEPVRTDNPIGDLVYGRNKDFWEEERESASRRVGNSGTDCSYRTEKRFSKHPRSQKRQEQRRGHRNKTQRAPCVLKMLGNCCGSWHSPLPTRERNGALPNGKRKRSESVPNEPSRTAEWKWRLSHAQHLLSAPDVS